MTTIEKRDVSRPERALGAARASLSRGAAGGGERIMHATVRGVELRRSVSCGCVRTS